MKLTDWFFGTDEKTTMQRQELLRHKLYSDIQNEVDRHAKVNKELIAQYKRAYEELAKNKKSSKAFQEALDCLCSYYHEWCGYNDACARLEQAYDRNFKSTFYNSLPLLQRLALRLNDKIDAMRKEEEK